MDKITHQVRCEQWTKTVSYTHLERAYLLLLEEWLKIKVFRDSICLLYTSFISRNTDARQQNLIRRRRMN